MISLAALLLAAAPAAEPPRTAILSAFAPELAALEPALVDRAEVRVAGTRFLSGTLAGQPVVLVLSGMSTANAAMTAQQALDRFRVSRVVFSGIAGGVDPALHVGDVAVPDRWANYLDSVFARADGKDFAPPPAEFFGQPSPGHFGMIYPKPVEVRDPDGTVERKLWFAADPALVAIVRRVAGTVPLQQCAATCLRASPRVVVGGSGVSGPAFVDNAAFRSWTFRTFRARVLDMESAAVAQVAYANGVPFVAFRSLSDLAGGDPSQNQAPVFFRLAAANAAAVVRAFVAALPPPGSPAPAPPPAAASSARP